MDPRAGSQQRIYNVKFTYYVQPYKNHWIGDSLASDRIQVVCKKSIMGRKIVKIGE